MLNLRDNKRRKKKEKQPHIMLNSVISLFIKGIVRASVPSGSRRVKHLLAVWETWVQSLGQEDPLEKDMATHSGVLVWRIPWTEEPGGLQSMGSQRVGHD